MLGVRDLVTGCPAGISGTRLSVAAAVGSSSGDMPPLYTTANTRKPCESCGGGNREPPSTQPACRRLLRENEAPCRLASWEMPVREEAILSRVPISGASLWSWMVSQVDTGYLPGGANGVSVSPPDRRGGSTRRQSNVARDLSPGQECGCITSNASRLAAAGGLFPERLSLRPREHSPGVPHLRAVRHPERFVGGAWLRRWGGLKRECTPAGTASSIRWNSIAGCPCGPTTTVGRTAISRCVGRGDLAWGCGDVR